MEFALRLIDKLNDERSSSRLVRRHRRNRVTQEKIKFRNSKLPWPGRRQSIRLAAPFAFAIQGNQNRRSVFKFFHKLRELTLERKLKVILDFSETDVNSSPAMLLFVAELDRIKRILKDDFAVSIDTVKNRRVDQLLYQIGVYSICGINKPSLAESSIDETVRHWRYATGERVNEQAERAFENIEGRLTPELAKGMWKSLSEAVVNSVEHAYLEPRGVNGPRMGHARWWMFSHEKDGRLSVAVCDLGIGIPRSLPHRWQSGLLTRAYDKFAGDGPDLRAIRAALVVGASSTHESHRGKGLPQIWNTLRSVPNASVTILSNHAQLAWNGEAKQEFSHEFSESLCGTIIMWSVDVTGMAREV